MAKREYRPKPREDLNGKVFGLLEVIGPAYEQDAVGRHLYKCRCGGCGRETTANASQLEEFRKKSCGSKSCRKILFGKKPDYSNYKYEGKTDCNCFINDEVCDALDEMLCRTMGKCSFYRNKNEVDLRSPL